MKHKLIKHVLVFAMMMAIILPMVTLTANAAGINTGMTYAEAVGLGNKDPRNIAADVIRAILAFLGIIAVVIILLGGFKWMTAAGNDDRVGEAKKIITAGVIGLLIVLASYGLANFVITQLMTATGTTTGT